MAGAQAGLGGNSPASARRRLRAPRKLRDLEFQGALGQGTFGVVRKAVVRATGEEVAVKQLLLLSTASKLDFLKEAKVLRLCLHPNLLRLVAVLVEEEGGAEHKDVEAAFALAEKEAEVARLQRRALALAAAAQVERDDGEESKAGSAQETADAARDAAAVLAAASSSTAAREAARRMSARGPQSRAAIEAAAAAARAEARVAEAAAEIAAATRVPAKERIVQHLYLVTEFCGGGSLAALVTDRSILALPWRSRVRFAHQIALGIQALHGNNLVHRDLKCENALLKVLPGVKPDPYFAQFQVVLCDFGLARWYGSGKEVHRHKGDKRKGKVHMTVRGSPWSLPPECFTGDGGYTVEADVFALGVVMLELALRMSAVNIPRDIDFCVDLAQVYDMPTNPRRESGEHAGSGAGGLGAGLGAGAGVSSGAGEGAGEDELVGELDTGASRDHGSAARPQSLDRQQGQGHGQGQGQGQGQPPPPPPQPPPPQQQPPQLLLQAAAHSAHSAHSSSSSTAASPPRRKSSMAVQTAASIVGAARGTVAQLASAVGHKLRRRDSVKDLCPAAYLAIIQQCVRPRPEERPDIDVVVQELADALASWGA
jgi:serine/threonine protein kinase